MPSLEEYKQQLAEFEKSLEDSAEREKNLTERLLAINREIERMQLELDAELKPYLELANEVQTKAEYIRKRHLPGRVRIEGILKPTENELREIKARQGELRGQMATVLIKVRGEITIDDLQKIAMPYISEKRLHITEKAILDNGVKIIRVGMNEYYDYDPEVKDWETYSGYLAFYKGKWIGFSGRRKGRHPGDETRPYSYIMLAKETLDILNDKPLKFTKTVHRSWGDLNEEALMGYREWIKEVEKLTNVQLECAIGMNVVGHVNIWVKFEGMRR